jgi:hypothetical protein
VNPWSVSAATFQRGGPVIVPRCHAPLGRALLYRRAAGEQPPPAWDAPDYRRAGWQVILGDRGLGDVLLALALARALAEGTGQPELHYEGPRPRLMRRCQLPMTASLQPGPHVVQAGPRPGLAVPAVPEEPPAWLDILDEQHAEVHAALPMRYYLAAEQVLGIRLPADHAPAPAFSSAEREQPCHVVFVTATSWPGRKDYGADGYTAIARAFGTLHPAPWRFTMITSADSDHEPCDGMEILAGPDAVDSLDVFASAAVVIGNDTGLTHLAALTRRPDGTGPQVIGLYSRHAHNKWTTGTSHHHAVATPFSRMLALADRCPVRDQIDDAVWAQSASITALPSSGIAAFACQVAGWQC